MKNDIVPTDGILTEVFDESKTEVHKTIVSKIEVHIEVSKIEVLTVVEFKIVDDAKIVAEDCNLVEERGCSLVDEVVATSVIDTLSCV